jgi:hypothetical protein
MEKDMPIPHTVPVALPVALSALLLAALPRVGQAASLYTEDFSGITLGPLAPTLPGSDFHLLDGNAQGRDDAPPQDRYLWLGAGWYAEAYDPLTHVGDTVVQSAASFDLLAGQTYTLSFDWSRGLAGGGNGPFWLTLSAQVGSHAVTYADVTGFYFPTDWQPGELRWTQATDEAGVHLRFTATGLAYSAAAIDNIRFDVSPVPEPGSWALMAAGLAAVGSIVRRRRR